MTGSFFSAITVSKAKSSGVNCFVWPRMGYRIRLAASLVSDD